MMQMQSEITEEQFASMVADKLVNKVMPQIEELVKHYHESDQGLDQKAAAKMLGCDRTTFVKYYLSQPGFPHYMKNSQMMFSRKAIEKWLHDNQVYA
ncbi:helix-turn-helix domain-containing protein [Lactiplantibacillus daowaiensis]|uniref:Helix-turn-helix domain-containing protein n=1 Tax=Lactiplantibacillus daowaiensis TaxID=2559918 RepID=A0ABW1RY67_9LACO|nr:helix-turn-helix domain-containing protein [Lactiplantibacillus daowaiensis]